jgi:hypothetical protein
VHSSCLEFDDERDVQAGERECAVDVEKAGGQERGGVGAQEDAPGFVMPGWRRDAVGAQDLADGGGCYPVAEPAQLALDPYYASPGVLPGQPQDQRDELVRNRRAADGLGWRHFAATRRRCQRSSVLGVTIRRARSPLT